MPFEAERDAAIEAARAAADLIRQHAGRARGVRDKGTHDLVTETDEAAERLILDRLARAFPDYDVLAEESTDAAGLRAARRDGAARRPRWIIDPIDGTTNFTHGVPPYAVSIALEAEGEIVAGVVHEVTRDETFAAVRGGGLTVNGAPATVSGTETLGRALVTTGFPFREFGYVDAYLAVLRGFMERTRGVRRPGAASVDLAWVACGRLDAYFEAGISPWDVAAGVLLVREGGGRVTALTADADPVYAGHLAATNGRLHAAVEAISGPLGEAYARAHATS